MCVHVAGSVCGDRKQEMITRQNVQQMGLSKESMGNVYNVKTFL